MKRIFLISTFILATPIIAQEELPKVTAEAVEKMHQFLKDEEKNYAERKNKIYDYYIKALKDQKSQASKAGNQDAVNAINKELIKILEMQGAQISKLASNKTLNPSQNTPKLPEISSKTSFEEVEKFFEAHQKNLEILKVSVSNATPAIEVNGSCIIAPFEQDKWTIFKGRMEPVNYLGAPRVKRKINDQNPGALCYSVNDGPWIPVDAVTMVEVKGEIRLACNASNVGFLKDKGEGTIRTRILLLDK